MSERFSASSSEKERQEADNLHVQIIGKNLSPREIIQNYNNGCDRYDKYTEVVKYTGPAETADTLGKLFPSNREAVYILDIAAGTGLCAVELSKLGFRKMDALDASEGMIKEAQKKGLYSRYIHDMLGDKPIDIPDGGLVVNANFYGTFVTDSDFVRHTKTLESSGKWKLVNTRHFEYGYGENGTVTVHEVY